MEEPPNLKRIKVWPNLVSSRRGSAEDGRVGWENDSAGVDGKIGELPESDRGISPSIVT
jgi:hypothetical protein